MVILAVTLALVPALGPGVAAAQTTSSTTTTAPPSTTTTTPKPTAAAVRTQAGKGTWYKLFKPGLCAHRTLPFGTVVTVTSTRTGKSVRCTVRDRGPFVKGFVIDLHPREFEQLAPRSAGVISVRLTW